MKKYLITCTNTTRGIIEIEAESEDDAVDILWNSKADEIDWSGWGGARDSNIEVVDIEEIKLHQK